MERMEAKRANETTFPNLLANVQPRTPALSPSATPIKKRHKHLANQSQAGEDRMRKARGGSFYRYIAPLSRSLRVLFGEELADGDELDVGGSFVDCADCGDDVER